jgi:putative ABC transport system permease protein
MMRLTLRNLGSRPLRTVLTILAVLLGVAMVTGTYVLTDQIDKGFTAIYDSTFKGTSVVVAPRPSFGQDEGAQTFTASTLDKVLAVPGVATAQGYAEGPGAVLLDGKAVKTNGAPTLVMSTKERPFDQSRWMAGRPARANGEAAIDKGFADAHHLRIGDSVRVATSAGVQTVRVSGIFSWGDNTSLGGAIMVVAPLADVQRWYGMDGRLSAINVAASRGVSDSELAARVRAAVPADLKVETGAQAAADAAATWTAALDSFLKPVLLAFAAISVFVGAFIIFNAFSITVAQRRREFAMLRALGASRRQVLGAVVGEALLIGLGASLAGMGAGLGVAKAINALFKALGSDIPTSGLVLAPRTIVIALAVGVVVTLLSALNPALKATRVPPVAALQEGATPSSARFSRVSTVVALVAAALGAGSLVFGMVGHGSANGKLALMGLGALLVFIAVAMLSRYVVRPLARVLGWPMERLSPTAGRLARENAGRNPSRTAATAAALMIGLAMVVFVAVFAQGLKGSYTGAIDRSIRSDLVVSDQASFLTLPAKATQALRATPGVGAVSAEAFGRLKLVKGGSLVDVNGIAPAQHARVWAFDWVQGDQRALTTLDARHVLVEERLAGRHGWHTGDSFAVTAPNGSRATFTVAGIYRDRMLMTGMTATMDAFRRLGLPTDALFELVKAAPGVPAQTLQRDVRRTLAPWPTQEVATKASFITDLTKQIDQILVMFYALLAMSVVISIFGIVNTLVLSVHERTREIGMLRAIGATRRQLRQMVRYESVITSVIGGLLGTAVGIAFGYLVTTRVGGDGLVFSLPWLQLGMFLVLAVVVGVVAAALPARRAGRTRILEAIQYE